MKKLTTLFAMLMLANVSLVSAQDAPLNPFASSPLQINPGMAGAFQNQQGRLFVNHLNRFGNLSGSPFVYNTFSADFPVLNKRIGIGMLANFNTPGMVGIKENNFILATSFLQPLSSNGNHNLVFGLQGGVLNKSINASEMTFGNQYLPGIGFDPNQTSRENLVNTNIYTPDFNFGMQYFGEFGKAKPWAGVAMYHLASPSESFFNNNSNKLNRKIVANAGAEYMFNDKVGIVPQLLYVQQGELNQITAGTTVKLNAADKFALQAGAFYRSSDAILASAGIEYQDFAIMMSYSVNQSSNELAKTANGFEISLRYLINKGKKKLSSEDEEVDEATKALDDSVAKAKEDAKAKRKLAKEQAKAKAKGDTSMAVSGANPNSSSTSSATSTSSSLSEAKMDELISTNKDLIQTNLDLIDLLRGLKPGTLAGSAGSEDGNSSAASRKSGGSRGESLNQGAVKSTGKDAETKTESLNEGDIDQQELLSAGKLTPKQKAMGQKYYTRRINELVKVNQTIKKDYEELRQRLENSTPADGKEDAGGSYAYYVVIGAYKSPLIRNTFMRVMADKRQMRTYVTPNEDKTWDMVYTGKFRSRKEAEFELSKIGDLDENFAISGKPWIWRTKW